MPSSIINSDDGVISGTSGLKSSGGDDGVTVFQQNGTERMRITSAGDVGVGTSSPAYKLDVSGQIRGDTFVRATSGSVGTFIVANSAGFGVVGTPTNHPLILSANDIERARVTTDGYLRMASGSGGIQFGGDTAAANALDDYEEGTWTPIDSSGAGLTFTAASGKYTKIGRQVTAWAAVIYPSTANGNNSAIGGLPFTIFASEPDRSGGMIGYKTDSTLETILGEDNNTYVRPRNNVGSQVSNATLSGDIIYWAITYNVS